MHNAECPNQVHYAQCHYSECRFTECHGTYIDSLDSATATSQLKAMLMATFFNRTHRHSVICHSNESEVAEEKKKNILSSNHQLFSNLAPPL
jgi:hypothetical protein